MPVIAQLVQADEDTLRDVIHRFNEIGQPFTRWSIRKLAAYLRKVHGRIIRIGREALRCLLRRRGITFQRTKTWKESPDPDRDAKLDRIEGAGPLPGPGLRLRRVRSPGDPAHRGLLLGEAGKPNRLPATYRRTHGVTRVAYFHGCYSVGDDRLWGVNRRRKGTANTLAALKSIRAARPDGAPIYIILDNLSAHTGANIRRWAKKNKVELCFTPTYASWPTRSRRTSARCGSSPWPTTTTAATPRKPRHCTATCAGATPTPATPTYSPPNARNAPASAAKRASAGADAPSTPQPDQPRTAAPERRRGKFRRRTATEG